MKIIEKEQTKIMVNNENIIELMMTMVTLFLNIL